MVLSIHHTRYSKLRKHLKSLRVSAGLTQIEIANRLKQEQSYVSKIERGERRIDVVEIKAIADLYKVSVSDFYGQ